MGRTGESQPFDPSKKGPTISGTGTSLTATPHICAPADDGAAFALVVSTNGDFHGAVGSGLPLRRRVCVGAVCKEEDPWHA